MDRTAKIFVSYSHQNEDWVLNEGKYKLIPWLERQLEGQAEIWTDHALKRLIGEEYTKLITEKILEADIVILLISQDFVSSQYIMDVELPLVQKQYIEGKIKVLPLLLTDLTKKGKSRISWIFDLQIYPNDTKPLLENFNNDAEWAKIKVEVLDGIENKIEDLKKKNSTPIIGNTNQDIKTINLGNPKSNKNNQAINNNQTLFSLLKIKKTASIFLIVFFLLAICASIFWFYQPKVKKSAQLLNKTGCSLLNLGQTDSAAVFFHEAILADTLFDSAYYNLGLVHLQRNVIDSANYYFLKTNRLNPNFTDSYNRLASWYLKNKDSDNAIDNYLKTIEIDPANKIANMALGKLYIDKDSKEDALKAYERIVSKDLTNIDALIALAILKKRMQLYQASIEICKKIISIDPNNGDGYLNMGNAYQYIKEYQKQKECYIRAARLGNNASKDWLKKRGYKWD